jgi:hypothetical protein
MDTDEERREVPSEKCEGKEGEIGVRDGGMKIGE